MKKPTFKTAMLIATGTMIALYAIGAGLLFHTVKHFSEEAMSTYGGDHVGALIALVEDDTAAFDRRNSAIWTLGQIGNRRALEPLRALRGEATKTPTGDASKEIVHANLEEAIKRIEGVSVSRWIYRFL